MKKLTQRLLLIVLLLAAIITVTVAYFSRPAFRLTVKEMTVELGSPLQLTAADCLSAAEEILPKIILDTAAVDTGRIGNYPVTIRYGNDQAILVVKVADTTAPVADLVTAEPTVTEGERLSAASLVRTVTDQSAVTVSFDAAQPLAELVFPTIGDQAAALYLQDAAGNRQTYALIIHIVSKDNLPPVLTGIDDLTLALGEAADLSTGVRATDETDGDLTARIESSGTVDPYQAGTYPIIYTVKDQAGNTTTIERSVKITDPYKTLRQNNKITVSKDPALYAVLNPVLAYLGDRVSRMGIVYYDLKTGKSFTINKDAQFRSASTAKLFVNMALYNRVAQGYASLSKKIYYQSSDYEGGTGVLQGMDKSKPYSLAILADYAMKYSDNIAFKMIRRTVGRDYCYDYYESVIGHATNRTMTSMGANDGYKLMKTLYEAKTENSEHMLAMLRQTVFSSMLPKYLPSGIVAHKVGFYGGFYHDVGIVYADDRPYILAVFSSGLSGPEETIAQVSKLVYDQR